MDIKICPSCGKKNSASDVCCSGCFTVLTGVKAVPGGADAKSAGAVAKIKCRVCGSENSAAAEKCRLCGAQLHIKLVKKAEGEGWKCTFCGNVNSFEERKCARCNMPYVKVNAPHSSPVPVDEIDVNLPWAFSSDKLPLDPQLIGNVFDKVIDSPYLKRIPERWQIASKIICTYAEDDSLNAFATVLDDKPVVCVHSEFLRVCVAVCAGYLTGVRGRDIFTFAKKATKGAVIINGEIIQQSLDALTESYLGYVLAHEIGHIIKRHAFTPFPDFSQFAIRRLMLFDSKFSERSNEEQVKLFEANKEALAAEYAKAEEIYSREKEREADMEAIQIIRETGMTDFFLEGQLLMMLTFAAIDSTTVEEALAKGHTHPASIERLRTFIESNKSELEKSLVTRKELEAYMQFAGMQ